MTSPRPDRPPGGSVGGRPGGGQSVTPLFRPEVIAEQEPRWLGRVVLLPRLSQALATAVALALTIALGILLAVGSHTRTERLAGWIVPRSNGDGAPPAVHLYASARSAGALHPGQAVLVRLEGTSGGSDGRLSGQVIRVEPSDLTVEEVAAQSGTSPPDGPLFQVDVRLEPSADGGAPLPTMPVEADVRVGSQPVWHWVLGLPGGEAA